MAEAAVTEDFERTTDDQTEPVAPENQSRGGRPKGSGKRAASDSPEEKRASFFERTSAFSDTDWENHLIYAYQWAPIVDLTKGGTEKKYRRLYVKHVTEEDIKRDLGSGTYELKLNQTNVKTRKEQTVDRVVISIVDYDFPPNIPPGAWLDDPRNVDWSWAKPLLDKKYKVNQNGGGNNGAPTWGEVMSFVRDEVNRGRPDLGKGPKEELMTSVVGILPKLLEQQNSAQDPSKFIEAIATAVKLMSPPVAPVLEHKPDPMLAFVLDELKEGRKQHSADMLQMRTQHAEEMKEMRAQNAKLLESQTKPPDIMSQLDTISNIANKFSGIAGEPKKFWETAIEEGVPKLIDLFGAFVTMPRAPAVLRAPAPNAMQPGVGQPPRVNPQPAPPQPSPDQTSSVPPQQTAEPEPEMNIIQRSMLINIANLASAALNLSLPGDQFAEQMCLKFGDLNYEAFIGSVPKDNLIALFRQVPEAWVYLQPFEATLPEFIEHFYAFNEVEEEPQAAAAEPLKTKAKGKKK